MSNMESTNKKLPYWLVKCLASPNWGEESEQEWGLLHTEMNGKEICRKYRVYPVIMVVSIRIYMNTCV